MAETGAIYARVRLDDKDAVKKLDQLREKIAKLQNELNYKTARKSDIEQQLEAAGKVIEQTQERLRQLRSELVTAPQGERAGILAQMSGAEKTLAAQEEKVKTLSREYTKITSEIEKGELDLQYMTNSAAELTQQVAASDTAFAKMQKAGTSAMEKIGKTANRIKGLIERVFVFSVVTRALRALRTYLTDYLKAVPEVQTALSKLKGAFIMMAEPILQRAIPALVTLLNFLARVAQVAAQLFGRIFGQSAADVEASAEATYDQQKALEGVGGAAKRAAKSLASFDEINQLSGGGNTGGGGGAAAGAIKPEFDLGEALPESELDRILEIVKMIGAALGAWKIGSALGMGLGNMLGLFLAIYSAINFIQSIFDAWNNGVTFANLGNSLLWLSGIAVGLYIAFGSTAAGISLIVGGLALLVTGIRDALKVGWTAENLIMTISGLLAAGVGIGLITGNWIPLLIAAIVGLLLALTVAMGHGEELIDGIRLVLEGFLDFFKGVFAGDIEKTVGGIGKIFEGLKKIIVAILESLRDLFNKAFDWLDKKTKGKITPLIDWLRNYINGFLEAFISTFRNAFDTAKEILQGLTMFIMGVFTGDWESAWKGLANIGIAIINFLFGALDSLANALITAVNFVIDAVNLIIANGLVKKGLELLGVTGWNGIPRLPKTAKLPRIPLLAEGAVIPPNREFLAVLGDQKSGTNIEAPLDTILQAFRQALNERQGGAAGRKTIILECNKRQFAQLVLDMNDLNSQRIGAKIGGTT